MSTSVLVFDCSQYIVASSLEFGLKLCIQPYGPVDLTRFPIRLASSILDPPIEQHYDHSVIPHEANAIEPVVSLFKFPQRLAFAVKGLEALMNAIPSPHRTEAMKLTLEFAEDCHFDLLFEELDRGTPPICPFIVNDSRKIAKDVLMYRQALCSLDANNKVVLLNLKPMLPFMSTHISS
jgi:hypothetical protein